jgi:hypothetical protein
MMPSRGGRGESYLVTVAGGDCRVAVYHSLHMVVMSL